MAALNRVVLIGNLTRDLELRHTAGGTAVAEFGMAVNGREKVGERWEERADFFDVKVWGAQAESCAQYLARGSLCGVDGKLRQDRWEKDGQNRSRVLVVADSVQFLDGRKGENSARVPEGTAQTTAADDFGGGGGSDDDIPF